MTQDIDEDLATSTEGGRTIDESRCASSTRISEADNIGRHSVSHAANEKLATIKSEADAKISEL